MDFNKRHDESKEDQPEQSNTIYYREKAARAGASLKNNNYKNNNSITHLLAENRYG